MNMRKKVQRLLAVALLTVLSGGAVLAASVDLNTPLPADPNVRMLTLDNGLAVWT